MLVLLVVEQLLQCGFLLRTALQYQEHALHRQRGGRGTEVELRACQRMRIALQHRQLSLIDGVHDKRLLYRRCPRRRLSSVGILRHRRRTADYCDETEKCSEQMLVSRRRNSSHDVDTFVGMWLRPSRTHKAGGRKWPVRFLCAGHYPEPGSQQRYPKFRQIATILRSRVVF